MSKAEAEGRNLSDVIREALQDYLDQSPGGKLL
ncbi:ribbon-helix-helix protein, CopG family [Rhodococcus koreensis]